MKCFKYLCLASIILCINTLTLSAENIEDNPLLIVYSPFGSVYTEKRSVTSQLNHATIGMESKSPLDSLPKSQVNTPYSLNSKGNGEGAGQLLYLMNNDFIFNHMYYVQNYESNESVSLPLLKSTSQDRLRVNWNQLLWTPSVSKLPFRPMLGATLESSGVDYNGTNQASTIYSPTGIAYYPKTSIANSSKSGSILAGLKYEFESFRGFVLPYMGIRGMEETSRIKYGSGALIQPEVFSSSNTLQGQTEAFMNASLVPSAANTLTPFSWKSVEWKRSSLVGFKFMFYITGRLQLFTSLERDLQYGNWNAGMTFNYLIAPHVGITINLEMNRPNEHVQFSRGAIGPSVYFIF